MRNYTEIFSNEVGNRMGGYVTGMRGWERLGAAPRVPCLGVRSAIGACGAESGHPGTPMLMPSGRSFKGFIGDPSGSNVPSPSKVPA
jgi:hypothetical protein